MTATPNEAKDDILAVFKTAWDTTGHPAFYENVKGSNDGQPPDANTPWARVALRHFTGAQRALTGGLGAPSRRFTRTGALAVQIFTPLGEGLLEAYSLAKVVTDAFEGVATPRQVWFRNVRVNEIGPDREWMQVNVLVDFTYDEIR